MSHRQDDQRLPQRFHEGRFLSIGDRNRTASYVSRRCLYYAGQARIYPRYRRSPLLKSSFKKHTVIDRHSVRGQEATQLKSILIVGFASQVCAFVTTCTVGHRYEGDGLAESRTVHSQWVLRRRDGVLQCQVSLCNPVADTVDYVRNITLRCSTKNVARGERDGGEPGTMSCLVRCSTSLSSQ